MFGLAHLCHIGPAEAGNLPLAHYANLIDSIDAYLQAARKEH